MAQRALIFTLVSLALAALGCEKKTTEGPSPASEETAPLADFPSAKTASSWVNGAPAPLAEARGKVVLVEAWHPT